MNSRPESRQLTNTEVRLIREWAAGVSTRRAAHFFTVKAYDARRYKMFLNYLVARGHIRETTEVERRGHFDPTYYTLTEQGVDWLIKCGITEEDETVSPNEWREMEEAVEQERQESIISVVEAAKEFSGYLVSFWDLLGACKAGEIKSAQQRDGKWYAKYSELEAYSGSHYTHAK